jgi:hypothetical protein
MKDSEARKLILDVLGSHLSVTEHKTLAFALGRDYEGLPGDGKEAKLLSLLDDVARRRRNGELVEVLREQRGDIFEFAPELEGALLGLRPSAALPTVASRSGRIAAFGVVIIVVMSVLTGLQMLRLEQPATPTGIREYTIRLIGSLDSRPIVGYKIVITGEQGEVWSGPTNQMGEYSFLAPISTTVRMNVGFPKKDNAIFLGDNTLITVRSIQYTMAFPGPYYHLILPAMIIVTLIFLVCIAGIVHRLFKHVEKSE